MGFFLNFAVTVFAEFIVNSQTGSSVLHAPNQLSNSSPSAGFAVRRTAVPSGYRELHSLGQEIVPTFASTGPPSAGSTATVSDQVSQRGRRGVTAGTAAGAMPTRTTEPLRNLDLPTSSGAHLATSPHPRQTKALLSDVQIGRATLDEPGRLAQLGERLPYTQEVTGSIPVPPMPSRSSSRGARTSSLGRAA